MDRLSKIIAFIESQKDIKISRKFEFSVEIPQVIEGSITIQVEPSVILDFDVTIYPFYPFQFQNTESIIFKNIHLKEYKHVMKDGNICIHTSHSADLESKLQYDFNSLRLWIKKFFIEQGKNDEHYEHILITPTLFEDCYYALCFNDVEKEFTKGEFGFISLSESQAGVYKNKAIRNFYLQSFNNISRKIICDAFWNPRIKSLPKNGGIYIYIEDLPAEYGKFEFNNWEQLKPYLTQGFLTYLHHLEKNDFKKDEIVPLVIGYKIPNGEIHWELIVLKAGDFPIYGDKNPDRKWISHLDGDREIVWGKTQNISYHYFFGRGKLNKKLTEGKILLIGVGAVGSIVANTLVRGGCRNICLFDYDEKFPENICRSEYTLNPLICSKVKDLQERLYEISPYVKIPALNDELKLLFENSDESRANFEEFINSFDIIFDCSTDNDLLYLISQLNIKKELFSFSISNKAVQLVCACDGNRYIFSQTQFKNVLNYDIDDLYEPTGCWSPTFKASYNDINLLVQASIKHINLKFENVHPIHNFVIKSEFDEQLKITINEF